MSLPLVITELIRAVERLVSLAATIVDKARVLGNTMFFTMSCKVAGAGEGGGTP